ncbi:conjugal transfer protein TraI [Flavobacterium beibuense]|uniref:Conjugal transfer protein TraI n=1 Tax=Flavobacterium beibuense TaxID=657326 RepID=A0A444WEW1_9FLAO|nr:conjugal transfer protein TraI [Flavobacterium beibuense]RYJ44306.1 hypothetical protein NU09_0916 [Flavobacterium beibuense]
MRIRNRITIGLLCLLFISVTEARTVAPAPPPPIFGIIKAAVKAAIKAIDLRIQRLQNKTIWLQNAQKEIENTLSKLKLNEISDWTQRQQDLYKEYYDELMQVKSVISTYQRVRDITEKQARLVDQYQRAWALFQQDTHFSDDEIEYMQKVYSGILGESLSDMDQVFMILESFSTQMSDARRLDMINAAADRIDRNYDDLTRFNRQNILLSLQRAKTQRDVDWVRRLYGLNH